MRRSTVAAFTLAAISVAERCAKLNHKGHPFMNEKMKRLSYGA